MTPDRLRAIGVASRQHGQADQPRSTIIETLTRENAQINRMKFAKRSE
jgi:hypothetical protein